MRSREKFIIECIALPISLDRDRFLLFVETINLGRRAHKFKPTVVNILLNISVLFRMLRTQIGSTRRSELADPSITLAGRDC